MAGESFRTMTYKDMAGLRQFVNLLRTELATITEEADAKLPKGSIANPLSPELVSREIRTNPNLRMLYKQLNPAQQAYVLNRHILNTPTRIESYTDGAANLVEMSPLEHDYQLVNNEKQYAKNKALWSGALRVLSDRPNYDEGMGGQWLGTSYIGKGLNALYSKLSGGRPGNIGAEAQEAVRSGGLSRQSKNSVNALAPQPENAYAKRLRKAVEYTLPAAVDTITLGSLARSLSAGSSAVAAAANSGNVAARVARPFVSAASATANTFAGIQNPLDATVAMGKRLLHPVKTIRNIKRVGKALISPRFIKKAPGLWFSQAANAAGNTFQAATIPLLEAPTMVSAVRDIANPEEYGVAVTDPSVAVSEYNKNLRGGTSVKKPAKKLSDNTKAPDSDKTYWDDIDTAATSAATAAGAVSGALLARRHRLLGALIGAGLFGATTAAARRYYKSKV